jgi:hypothetical protein
MGNEMYMEDVGNIAADATEFILEKLAEFGIVLEGNESDEFFDPIFEILENYCDNDYKHQM